MRTHSHGLSRVERAELWRRWREGERVVDIARALGRAAGSVHSVLLLAGGIQPAVKARNRRNLSLPEREEISRALVRGDSIRKIAIGLNRSPSTISREVTRNGGRIKYRATTADVRADKQAVRPKQCKLAMNGPLRRVVAAKLQLHWSPRQISGWLELEFPEDEQMRLSHETIYRSLFIQARGILKKELRAYLRTWRRMRQPHKSGVAGPRRSNIVGAISIRERPASVEDRAVPGHWEGDLISGSNNSHIATLVERMSRFTMLIKVEGKDTESVVTALAKHVRKLPAELRRSLTWDRGSELAQHEAFTVATNVKVYFCDPQSPWQRGSNENTNGLLRQYFPKGTDLSIHTQAELNKVARQLNERPRQTLEFRTPAYMLNQALR
jgi:IS30 family transposase